jgi:hypothetical protein
MWLEGESSPLVVGCEIHLNTVAGMGGGIAVDMAATPTIRDCDIHDNTASSGGGVCSSAAGGVIEGCFITGNTATFGGGVALMSTTGCVIKSTRVDWNEAVHSGGGLYGSDSSFEMRDCQVEDNSTQGAGGAVWLLNTDAVFTGIEFLRNSAAESTGGILIDASTLTVDSSEIEGNGIGLAVVGTGRSLADARYNWWGHNSGPHHPLLNPGGLGDAVGDGVGFTPWNVVTGIDEHEPPTPTSWSAIKATYR